MHFAEARLGFGRENNGEIDLAALAIGIIIRIVVLSPVLQIAGRAMAGGSKAKFTCGIWIVVLGTIVGAVFEAFFAGVLGLISSIVVFIIWLALVTHFFDTGWLKALAIVILVVIIYVIIAVVLAMLGLAIIIGGSIFA
ncbi:MAG TPA: hypothetical protein VJ507_01700 [Candidatus Bathyarchaeia archaeon]|nr:hypothetical protein [Candidatus Bathyarchaeia archaeon]